MAGHEADDAGKQHETQVMLGGQAGKNAKHEIRRLDTIAADPMTLSIKKT